MQVEADPSDHVALPNMLLVPNNSKSRHFYELEQQRYGYHDRRFQHNCHQEPDKRSYSYVSQDLSNHASNDTTSIMLNALENFSAKISMQPLAQAALGSIQKFSGKDKATTIPWLDQVELVVKRTSNDLVEVGISKLKGLSLGNINTIRKQEVLTWHKFRQILIENYSNIPYTSDAMVAHSNLTQQDDESTSQYLIRAKMLLENINHTAKVSPISGKGLNNLALIQGL